MTLCARQPNVISVSSTNILSTFLPTFNHSTIIPKVGTRFSTDVSLLETSTESLHWKNYDSLLSSVCKEMLENSGPVITFLITYSSASPMQTQQPLTYNIPLLVNLTLTCSSVPSPVVIHFPQCSSYLE